MKKIIILLLTLLVHFTSGFSQNWDAYSKKPDYSTHLQGSWTTSAWVDRDKKQSVADQAMIIFEDNNKVIAIEANGSDTLKGTFVYNQQKNPNWIDFNWKNSSGQSSQSHGIIEWIDYETARIFAVEKSKARPVKFEDDPDLDRSAIIRKHEIVVSYLKDNLIRGKWDITLLYNEDINHPPDKKYQTITFQADNRFKLEGTGFFPGSSGEGSYELNTNEVPNWIDLYTVEAGKIMGLIQEHLMGYKIQIFNDSKLIMGSRSNNGHPLEFTDIEFEDPNLINYNFSFLYLHPSSNQVSTHVPEKKEGAENSSKTEPENVKGTEIPATTGAVAEVPIAVTSKPGDVIKDIERNSYKTIVLGNGQQWMAENLRTATYNNGDAIENVTKKKGWYQSTTGAWCHYNNSSEYDVPYGKLYNWYSVVDNRQICPTGWHVPTLSDWNKLSIYLDSKTDTVRYMGDNRVGGILKSTNKQYWASPNGGANDEIGFSALAAGMRIGVPQYPSLNPEQFGVFDVMGYYGTWWTSTMHDKINRKSVSFMTSKFNATAGTLFYHMTTGLSCRCIKD